MSDFLRFACRHQKIHFSTSSYPVYNKSCWREVRSLGTHTAYVNGVPHVRTGGPWSVCPANVTHIATGDACHRWKIDPDESDIFVVFAVAEILRLWSPSVQPYQSPAPAIQQYQPNKKILTMCFTWCPPERRSFLYTSATRPSQSLHCRRPSDILTRIGYDNSLILSHPEVNEAHFPVPSPSRPRTTSGLVGLPVTMTHITVH
ncbi:hypothetical protein EDD18DRAFT_692010 [Armillaria luteobubalina]|uniref:Uncharacterized protein n=1 Tax=Armillaria luteobubalina TaxID=153913 RepID=A0AA39UXX6_9AGAR|nr:hypothetical protein EDD18DRAFT_692010 [Armillaria luteobubalina]